MTAQVIPATTTELAQTEWTDLTVAADQALMEHNVKQVTATDNITNL